MEKKMASRKKLAAAMSAVTTCIKTEEEAMMALSASNTLQSQPSAPPNLWGLSGRQAMMQNRNLMQLKTFHRTTPR